MKTLLFPVLLLLFPLISKSEIPEKDIVSGNNQFAFDLFHQLRNQSSSNLFYSPFSISTALAMTYAGASSRTAEQMRKTLYFGEGADFHNNYKKLIHQLISEKDNEFKLRTANGLWAQADYPFHKSYLDLVLSAYNPELKNVDFSKEVERENARLDINHWVEKRTEDKIKNLLNPDDLSPDTKLVLVNAIYFYGAWNHPFLKQMSDEKSFFLSGEDKIVVPFMNDHSAYKFYEDAELKALEIPYQDNRASMVIFLPREKDGIKMLEKKFNYQYFNSVTASMMNQEVSVSIPKFKMEAKFNLEEKLSSMGMPDAFTPFVSDFSAMSPAADLYISKVIHQAFIKLDEAGTEAAAATAVIMMKETSARPIEIEKEFRADHPFLFVIRDNSTGSILFIGKLINPTK
jgi:serpin B